jgi:hypothetical protein
MTYIYVATCWGPPTFSSVNGLCKNEKDGTYWISGDIQEKIPAIQTEQYLLNYVPKPDTISNYRETLYQPQKVYANDLQNGYVMVGQYKWSFSLS